MSYVLEHLVTTRSYSEACAMLDNFPDETLFTHLSPEQFPGYERGDPAWRADDPEHDLAAEHVRARLRTDLDVAYRNIYDPEANGYEIAFSELPNSYQRVVTCVVNTDDCYDDDADLVSTMSPVGRLNRLTPLCGEPLQTPREQAREMPPRTGFASDHAAGITSSTTTWTLNVDDSILTRILEERPSRL